MGFPTATPSVSPAPVGAIVKTLRIGLESAIDCGDYVLVASSTEADAWHVVTTNPLSCTCSGFFYRASCKHLAVGIQAAMSGVETATPVEAKPARLYYDSTGRTHTPESRVPRGPAALRFGELAGD